MVPVGIPQGYPLKGQIVPQLEKHDGLPEELGTDIDENIQPDIIWGFTEGHDQEDPEAFDNDIAETGLLEILHAIEEPGDVQHRRQHRKAGQIVVHHSVFEYHGDKYVICDHRDDHIAYLHIKNFKEGLVAELYIISDLCDLPVAVGIHAEDAEENKPVHDRAGILVSAERRNPDMGCRIRRKDQRKNNFNQLIEDIVYIVFQQFFIHNENRNYYIIPG